MTWHPSRPVRHGAAGLAALDAEGRARLVRHLVGLAWAKARALADRPGETRRPRRIFRAVLRRMERLLRRAWRRHQEGGGA